jgi:phosphoserine aminotransferase
VINLWLHELTMEHYQNLGGLDVLARNVQRRKDLVYAEIDGSDFYHMPVNKAHRSAMSIAVDVVVRGEKREDLAKRFVSEASSEGMIQLFGHPVRGGLRVTLYHGVTDEAVDALVKFMRSFRLENAGK